MPTDKSNKIRLGDSSEINETLKPIKIGELLSPIELSKKVVRLTPGITFMLGNSLEISSDDTEENIIKGSINVLGDFKVNGSGVDDVSVANLDARLNELTATQVTIGDATDVTIDFEGGIQIGQGAVFMTEPSVTTGAGQVVWSWKQGNKLDITLASGSQNITFDTAHPLGGCNLTLKLTQPSSGSAGTVGTWTATGGGYDIKWAGGSAPTLSTANNAIDILSFYFDGSTYFGVASLNFS